MTVFAAQKSEQGQERNSGETAKRKLLPTRDSEHQIVIPQSEKRISPLGHLPYGGGQKGKFTPLQKLL